MKKQGRVDRRVEEFRGRVLDAASDLFESRGVDATKIDDICEAADVAKRTLCNHFPTKAHIVQELSRDAVSRTVAVVDGARIAGGSMRERLSLLFAGMREGWVDSGPMHREFVGAYFHAAHGTSDAAEGEIRLSDAILALLAEGKEDELPRGCAPETFAEIVLGSIYSITLEWIHRDDYDMDAHLANASDFLVGLLPIP
jgi:AcrR family transcriptional regulator